MTVNPCPLCQDHPEIDIGHQINERIGMQDSYCCIMCACGLALHSPMSGDICGLSVGYTHEEQDEKWDEGLAREWAVKQWNRLTTADL